MNSKVPLSRSPKKINRFYMLFFLVIVAAGFGLQAYEQALQDNKDEAKPDKTVDVKKGKAAEEGDKEDNKETLQEAELQEKLIDANKENTQQDPNEVAKTQDAKTQEVIAQEAKAADAAKDKTNKKKGERFVPSESISEDLAVSFPVDI